jgi:hypothetical protein
MKSIVITTILASFFLWIGGCTAAGSNGAPPTPAQLQSAQQINAGLAVGAHLAYSAALTHFATAHATALAELTDPAAIAKENATYAKIVNAESLVPPLLDQLDKAAAGDPTSFSYLAEEEAARIGDIYLFGGGAP